MTVVKTGLASAGLAAVAFALLHVLRRDLDAVSTPLSFYALGDWGWLFAAGCVAMAGAVVALALTWQARLRTLARVSLVAIVLGLVLVAIFRTDPWMPWDRGPTATGAVHNLAFVVLVAGFMRAGWDMARVESPARRTLALLAAGFGVVFAATIIAVVMVLVAGGRPGFVGLMERVQFAVGAAWVARALTAPPASPPPRSAARGEP